MKKKYLFLLILIIAVAAGVLLFFSQPATSEQTTTTVTVTRGDIAKFVMATGILKPSRQVNVGAQVTGQIKKIYVKQGDKVSKGQLLAEIDPVLQQNELRKAQSQLASAIAQKRSTAAQQIKARLEYQRQQQLMRDDAGVRSDLEKARAAYLAEKEQLAVDETNIQQARIAVETATVNLNYTRITAPIAGEVLGIVTNEGQTVVSTQTAPTILVIANLEKMRVQIRISENDILKVKPGQPLWFNVAADASRRYNSIIDNIQPVPAEALNDPSSGGPSQNAQQQNAVYYTGEFLVDNPQGQLRTWMTAQVYIKIQQHKNVLLAPVAAVEALPDGTYQVEVVNKGKREYRKVTTGLSNHQFYEITSSLKEGDILNVRQGEIRNG